MDALVELADVTVARGGHRLLKSVSWATGPGQHWVVVGPNGAGKTTLARTIAGKVTPTSGRVSVFGQDVADMDPQDLASRVGFSSSTLIPRIPGASKVRAVVMAAAWGLTRSAGEEYEELDTRRAGDLMEAFGVRHLEERRFSTLSEGERQRVLLARAFMADPEVLILDEPTAGLDLGAREVLVGALTELCADPASPQIILITHQIEEIAPGFTHAALVAAGRIVDAGPIEQTLTGVNLSRVFELPLTAGQRDGRWYAHRIEYPTMDSGHRA